MREIKFRAWFEDGEMLRLDLANHKNILRLYNQCEDAKIMQFTGLLDKNGKEIYEGDIVEFEDKIGVIEWQERWCGFSIRTKNDGYDVRGKWEVIGNIYENPELMKEEIRK